MYVCRRCGAQLEDSFVEDWGTTNESSGLGPQPVCPQLRADKRGPKTEDGQATLAVCRGDLAYQEGTPDASRAVATSRVGERRPAPVDRAAAGTDAAAGTSRNSQPGA
jgi:hypothetical protein